MIRLKIRFLEKWAPGQQESISLKKVESVSSCVQGKDQATTVAEY